ncbi:MAG TPA: endolytic transglycosylase MltG [Azonexus sp.]
MRFLTKLLFLLALLLGLAAGGLWWAGQPLELRESPVDFRIVGGSSLRSAIVQMREAGIVVQPSLMLLLARAYGAETGIKAGSYSVSQGVTPRQLLDKLVRGKVTQGEVTLVEGWTLRQWRARLDAHPDLVGDSRGLTEAEISRRLGIDHPRLEGWLFPDTYLFDKQSSAIDLMARAVRAMERRLAEEWAGRAANLPYRSPYEALIMASIIEKETGREADREQVAAVFVNRLRLGMPLQTDPTVIYGLGDAFDGNLRKRDLLADTPYNTYTRRGLPPTPIAMPGLASIRAALHPAASNALYFVARGDGSSQFSSTLDEHNRAVNQYQRGGK